MQYYGCEGEETRRGSERGCDRERPDLYKKEVEIFMDVSVLIGKPLGALRPSPPITDWEEVNARTQKHARLQWLEVQSEASTPRLSSPD